MREPPPAPPRKVVVLNELVQNRGVSDGNSVQILYFE